MEKGLGRYVRERRKKKNRRSLGYIRRIACKKSDMVIRATEQGHRHQILISTGPFSFRHWASELNVHGEKIVRLTSAESYRRRGERCRNVYVRRSTTRCTIKRCSNSSLLERTEPNSPACHQPGYSVRRYSPWRLACLCNQQRV
jgi:hypothetical protein